MFADKFRDLCATRGKTPAEVAKDLGLSNSLYTYWRKHKSTPKQPILGSICEYFNVDESYFYDIPVESVPVTEAKESRPNIEKAFIPTNQEIEIIERYRQLPVMEQMELLQLLQKLGQK